MLARSTAEHLNYIVSHAIDKVVSALELFGCGSSFRTANHVIDTVLLFRRAQDLRA
jgi:hypothetical protein